jgi:hypothetical protein
MCRCLGNPEQQDSDAGGDRCRAAGQRRELGHQNRQDSDGDEAFRNQGCDRLQHHPTHLVGGQTHIIQHFGGIAPQMQAIGREQTSLQQAG